MSFRTWPVFHHKTNALEFGYVDYGVARYRDRISKFSRLNGPNLGLPSQHFCGIDGDGTDDIKCRDSGSVQIEQRGVAGRATKKRPPLPPVPSEGKRERIAPA